MCGRVYNRQRNNFPATHSPLFMKNGGYLPVCNTCIDSLLSKYKEEFKDEAAAVKRICMKFDIYWNEGLYNSMYKRDRAGTIIRAYISGSNLYRYVNKNYDDTIAEEAAKADSFGTKELSHVQDKAEAEDVIDQKDIDFWGPGFTAQEYDLLNKKYQRWVGELPSDVEITVGMETLYRQICMLEITINRNSISGKPNEQAINQLNNLLGSVNAKPVQRKQEEAAEAPFDSLPFGVGIRMCENTRPIPKPLPQFEDVDHVVKYITVWFLGHLCKMLHIKNAYCKMYEDEINRLRVERPDLDSEDDESFFNDIFGDETA